MIGFEDLKSFRSVVGGITRPQLVSEADPCWDVVYGCFNDVYGQG